MKVDKDMLKHLRDLASDVVKSRPELITAINFAFEALDDNRLGDCLEHLITALYYVSAKEPDFSKIYRRRR